MDPGEAKDKVGALLDGAMRGRTMYVVPYVMGPASSPISKVGVEVTDSPYVVASMKIMSRMGKVAMERLGASPEFVPGCIRWVIWTPSAIHRALSAREIDLERGFGLRRQRAAGEKVFCVAHC